MIGRGAEPSDGRIIDVKTGMEALDALEESLDRMEDRLNALWDKVVRLEEEE